MRFLPLLACALVAAPALAQSTATYRVTFESTWSAQTHPIEYPGGAHYSPLVGATHATPGAFWESGETATAGLEEVAETGRTTLFLAEVAELIAAGEANGDLLGGALSTSPGAESMTFEVDEAFPLVTLVTMIAPSPDWFVGVDGLRLYREQGWVPAVRATLRVWDAGTDSGATYTSPNADTQPREAIQLSTAAPFAEGVPVGSFLFERLSIVSSDETPHEAFALGAVAPHPTSGPARLAVTLPASADVSVRVYDVLGRDVAHRVFRLGAGEQRVELPTAGLAPGAYVVRVRAGEAESSRRLTVVR